MHAYLTSVSVDELTEIVIGRTRYTPVLTEHDLIAQALSALTARRTPGRQPGPGSRSQGSSAIGTN